ncbi:MAG: hypothetical protein KDB21_03310 [Acidimicrobiales bacterium]|nr:hypothetical protein [Acidimicrobiales bacterium]
MVPEPWDGRRSAFDRFVEPCFVELDIAGETVMFVVERTRADAAHACTVDDVARMLAVVDPSHISLLGLVVLRQPTRTQQRLASVWGRLRYYLEVGRHVGAALILDASEPPSLVRFDRHMGVDAAAELERFQAAGHEVREDFVLAGE